MLYSPSYHIYGHMHLLESTDTDRMGLWVYAVGGQALARNTPLLTTTAVYTQAGLGTEEVLWEIAAGTLAGTVAGMHHNGVGATGGSTPDHTSGLEHRFYAQVAHASLGISRQTANGLVLEILRHYEGSHKDPPPGVPFPQLYEIETLEPLGPWLDLHQRVLDELAAMGLDVHGAWRKVRRERGL